MAEVPTQGEAGGIATVAPDDRVPDDYQHLHATPEAFGAAIGRGMQQFGEGALKASRFYGQVAADDVFNTYQTNVNHLLYGDPNKTTTGPDGATIADRGYFGLKGEDAMRARPDIEKQLDSLMQSSRQQLPTPESQMHFDTYSRRLRTQMGERIGAHADSSFNTYAGTVNKQSEAVALNGIASNPLDDEAFNHNVADLTLARKKQVDIAGLGAPGAAAAETTSLQDAWKTRILSIGVHDPAAASKMAEAHQKELGTEYQGVAEHLRSRNEAANGDSAADAALKASDNAASKGVRMPPQQQQQFFRDRAANPAEVDPTNLNPVFSDRLQRAIADAEQATGSRAQINSMHRGYDEQAELYRRYRSGQGGLAAAPGLSRHERGEATDISRGPVLSWLHQHAGEYGLEFLKGQAYAADPVHIQLARGAGGGGGPAGGPRIPTDAVGALQQFESFRDRPYWDKSTSGNAGAWRTGYGSDTITHPDGSYEKVTAFTPPVTEADAARDLNRRIGLVQKDVQGKIGPDAWSKLPPGAQGAITSVGYNYGTVPNSVIEAAKSGDKEQLAQAIASLPANPSRRATEAAMVNGKYVAPQGVVRLASRTMSDGPMPGGGGARIQPAEQTPVGGLGGATQAPAAPDGTQTAENTPQPLTPEERKAAAYQHVLDDPDLNPSERQHALNRINQVITAQQVTEAATEKAKKERDEKAGSQYLTRVLNHQMGTNIIHEIANDPNLTMSSKSFLMGAIEKWSGDDQAKNTREYGTDYFPTLRRILADPGDPNRISDSVDILKMAAAPDAHLTISGANKLIEQMGTTRKSLDNNAVERSKLGQLNYAKGKLSFEQDMGPIKLRDPAGEALFNAQFIPKFEAAFDAHIKAGKNPWEFLTQENTDKLLKGMRSKAQMDMDRMRATSEATGDTGQKLPAPPVAPAPTGVDPKVWSDVTQAAPVLESGPVSPGKWQQVLTRLLSEPTPEIIAAFDKTFGNAVPMGGAQLIASLTGKPVAPVAPTASPAAQQTSTPNNAPITPAAPAAPAAAGSGGGVTAAPAAPAAAAPAEAPAAAPTVERTGPRMEGGAFYGNEPEPTQADIEAHDRDKAAREEAIRKNTEAFKQKREPERAAIDATRKGAESIAARGQAEHDKSTLEKLDKDEAEARDRLERLEKAAKVGARVGSQTKRLNDQIKDIAAQRKDIEARMKKGPNG